MIDARLQLALDSGGLDLAPEGRIAVFNPPVDADLDVLAQDRCHVIHDFKPHFDVWEAKGFTVMRNTRERYAASIVCLPRSKVQARALIAEACSVSEGPVVIDGQKTDGADGILREMRARVTVHGPVSKAHGKLFWIGEGAAEFFADWAQGPALTDGGFWTAPGVFSADGVDLASAMLAEALPEKLGSQVADLGAGWGFLGAHVLERAAVQNVHLVEAGHLALECARHNITDERARFYWDDVTKWEPPHRMDSVVMNPPFHTGRAAEPALGQAFVATAARVLSANGTLWMVANRHLPYEAELKIRFSDVEEIGGDARFKLFCARRPMRQRR
ncbi:MAG: class I SAM-dependent methyltransferase [Sulfitobacter sp.]